MPIEAEESARGFHLSSSGDENSDTNSNCLDIEMEPVGNEGAAAAGDPSIKSHEELMHCPHYRAAYKAAAKAAWAVVPLAERPTVLTKELSDLLNEDPNNRAEASGQVFQKKEEEQDQKSLLKDKIMFWFSRMKGRR
jgi:hypothetical protein